MITNQLLDKERIKENTERKVKMETEKNFKNTSEGMRRKNRTQRRRRRTNSHRMKTSGRRMMREEETEEQEV